MTTILLLLTLFALAVLVAFRDTLHTLIFLIRFELAIWMLGHRYKPQPRRRG